MEDRFKINVPKPCLESWDQMKPTASGRFCGSCAKNVVDFTGMKTLEIRDYFIQNKAEKTCGMFNSTQLGSVVITIPRRLIFKQMPFQKSFLLVLFITMGTTLFSCTDANGDRQSIDQVEVSGAKNQEPHRTLGMTITPLKAVKDKEPQVSLEEVQLKFDKTPMVKGKPAISLIKRDKIEIHPGDTIHE